MSIPGPAGVAVITCDVVLMVIGVVAVLLRIVAMYMRGRQAKAHDYLIFLGLVLSVAAVANQIHGIYNGGIGTHLSDIPAPEQMVKVVETLKAIVTADILWILSTCLIKLSILLMYLELFGDKTLFHLACTCVIALTILTMFAFLLTQFIVCLPFSDNWRLGTPEVDKCHKRGFEFANATAAVNMVIDFGIAILPVPVLMRLQVPVGKKVGLAALLSLGAQDSICAINITRLATFHTLDPEDITYTIAVPSILSSLELYLGIVVACAPFIRSLFKPLPPRAQLSDSEASGYTVRTASSVAKKQGSVGGAPSVNLPSLNIGRRRSATLVGEEIQIGIEMVGRKSGGIGEAV